jgi:tRNA A37 threonylcarbamoyladenosine synthetase subunit TsaC/SUA5/YrdC
LNITKDANLAAKWILDKKVIAYPTEGVWGIGGLNVSENVNIINLAKGRDVEKKYILLFHSFIQLVEHFNIEDKYHSLIKSKENTFTTMLIPTETNKVAARIPGDKNLLNFLKLLDEPIISTSANLSGHRACKNIKEISTVFDGKIFGALDSQLGGEKKPSRILDLENNEYIR